VFHWLLHAYFATTGANYEAGKAYGFWSGFGGATVIFSGTFSFLLVHYRHINCKRHRCWRIGHHQSADGTKLCRHHHPVLAGRHLTDELIQRLHREHKARQ
jgi:hypothetical protein